MTYHCDAAECTSNRSKDPFMADVRWVKWLRDFSAEKTLIQHEGKGQNVDVMKPYKRFHAMHP